MDTERQSDNGRLRRVLDSLVHSVITMDESGLIVDANAATEAQLGYRPDELIGRDVTCLIPEPHATAHRGYVQRYLDGGKPRIIGHDRVVQAVRKDGTRLDVSLAVSEAWEDGQRLFSGVLRDVSLDLGRRTALARERDELAVQAYVNRAIEEAKTAKQLLTRVLEALGGLVELQIQKKIGAFLIGGPQDAGYSRSRAVGPRGLRLVETLGTFEPEFLAREAWIPMGSCLCGRAAASGDVLVSGDCFEDQRHEHRLPSMTAHGHYIVPLKSAGQVLGVIFLFTDSQPSWDERRLALLKTLGSLIGTALDRIWTLEELRESRAHLERLATEDMLTHVANRRGTLERLERERARADRQGGSMAVISVDVDHFKSVNDCFGHAGGDATLVEIARRLEADVRPYDMVGRVGGEEFLVVLPGATQEEALEVAERLRRGVARKPITARDDIEVSITISQGVAATGGRTEAALSNDQLLGEADVALYRAKEGGRNRVASAQNGAFFPAE